MSLYATWNVNSLRVRLPQLLDWLGANPVDVIALQETKITDAEFPIKEIESLGYRAAYSGQKAYNGVATLARVPIEDVVAELPGAGDAARRILAASIAGVRVVNVYVPNGQAVGSDKYAYKLGWLEALERFLKAELDAHSKLLVLGDFNVAPGDDDVYDPQALRGSVLVSDAERAALARVTSLGVVDVFRRFVQPPQSYSWWDYRQGAYRRNHGLRIDLIFASPAMAAQCNYCRIDREPRAWERPSDHTPCVADFDISAIEG